MGIDWVVWVGLFVGYFILDFLGTKNVITIQQLKVIPNANLSAATSIISIVGAYYVIQPDDLLRIIPIGLGVWCGSVVALKWEIKIRRREDMAKNLSNVKNPTKRVKHKGVHAKTKQSKNRNSKNYVKPSVGQGK